MVLVSALEQMLNRLNDLKHKHGQNNTSDSRTRGFAAIPPPHVNQEHGTTDLTLTRPVLDPNRTFEQGLSQEGMELEDLWSAIDWDMAFPSLSGDLLTTF